MKYKESSIRRKGRKDGRNHFWKFWPFKKKSKDPVPSLTQKEIAAFENVLFNFTSNDLEKISEKWSNRDQVLKPDVGNAYVTLVKAEERYRKEKSEVDAIVKDYEKAKHDYFDVPSPSFSPILATILLIFIAIGEFPLNSMVFQLFGENKTLTYVIAALICVSIPVAAHFFGMALKNVHKTLTDKFLMAGLPVLILLEIGAIALVREKFFEAMMLTKVVHLNISSQQLTIIFVIINLAIFFIASFISYSSAHEDSEDFRSKKKLFLRLKKRYDKEYKEEVIANKQLEHAEKVFKRLRERRAKIFKQYQAQAEQKIKVFKGFVWCYRDSNINVRTTGGAPPCFNLEIILPEIPVALKTLDEDFKQMYSQEKKSGVSSIDLLKN
jgi:hypothetical protein